MSEFNSDFVRVATANEAANRALEGENGYLSVFPLVAVKCSVYVL